MTDPRPRIPLPRPPRYGARFVLVRTESGHPPAFEAAVATPDGGTRHRVRVDGDRVEVEPPLAGWCGDELAKLARSLVRRGRARGSWWRAPRQARG